MSRRFEADDIDGVIASINRRGYGLTFGLHTRIEARVQRFVDGIHAGNIYVNRNQIGAVVRLAALRRRGAVGHRAEGRRAALSQAFPQVGFAASGRTGARFVNDDR